jgi:hypothetical protein
MTSHQWLNYGPTWRTTYRAGCDRWLSVHLDSLHRWRWSLLTAAGQLESGVADTEAAAVAAAENAMRDDYLQKSAGE